MLRSILLKQASANTSRVFLASNLKPCRNIHWSPLLFKKRGKEPVQKDEPTESAKSPEIDFDEVSQRFQGVLDKFAKHANESKLGKTNPQIFDNLQVETPDGELPYTAVAITALKGRNFIMTVFDPANVKHVVNAVLASDLNMNPVLDPSNKQMLKVPLPPVTTESKKESIKQLKAVFDKFKNGAGGSGKHAHTLSAIRADIKNKISTKKKMNDQEQALWKKVESVHKEYVKKLEDSFKAAETAIMK
ncbi:ribosome recycling factor [Metschnikowia bicuspidata var. bicuspidata NRRL YB-4993]|uniref:Ribosome-recycling factor, mitochondrial n=1 Tax=Metschnikowia bicuspidata var. bicuspidata NRRL YB-4993 TaxID=869754 RepID=A0A1A0HKC6_9ASCO|nr:ribosome recycling factor [Metschnikowia bicuspidata var. bicuspidata NRRL YB-4993]OBA24456.1 ribosome recycling factor [Metschnikowia bicuspidata var. bicuspidata NRRL YB-4993]